MTELLERGCRESFDAETLPSNSSGKKLFVAMNRSASEVTPKIGRAVFENVSHSGALSNSHLDEGKALDNDSRFSTGALPHSEELTLNREVQLTKDSKNHVHQLVRQVVRTIRIRLLHGENVEKILESVQAGDASFDNLRSDGLLDNASRLDERGQTDAALDIIYDQIDELLLGGRFAEVDAILEQTAPEAISMQLILALLTSTLPARQRLEQRASFFARAEQSMRCRGILREGLLVGLE